MTIHPTLRTLAIATFIATSVASCQNPEQKFDITVVDEQGIPVEGVECKAWFKKPGQGKPIEDYFVIGHSSASGKATLSGETIWAPTSVEARKDGYYLSLAGDQIDQEALREVQSLSSSEIYAQLLNASPSPSRWKEMRVMTLKERQKDLILEIRKTLSEFPIDIDTMGRLTSLASLVSPEFEAEVADEILRHPSSREFDIYFTGSEDFRNHFREDPELLRSALDMLLAEGRVEEGSDVYKKWENSIDRFNEIKERRAERKPEGKPEKWMPGSRSDQRGRPDEVFGGLVDLRLLDIFWIVSGVLLIVVFVVVLIRKK